MKNDTIYSGIMRNEKADQYYKDSLDACKSDLNKALMLIEKAIEIAPDVSLYWTVKASYFYKSEKYDEALESIERAIKIDPKDFRAWGYKGLIKRNIGNYIESAEAYIESIKIKPDFNTYTLLSSVQREFDVEAAIQSAKKAIELNPDWDEAKDMLKKAENAFKRFKHKKR